MTSREKEYGEAYLIYYSGRVPNIPKDVAKLDVYIYGTEEEKILLLKAFIKDVLLPQEQVNKTSITNTLAIHENLITEYITYTKET